MRIPLAATFGVAAVLALTAAGCGLADGGDIEVSPAAALDPAPTSTTTTPATTTTESLTTTPEPLPSTTTTTTSTTTTTTTTVPAASYHEQSYAAFADADGVVLHFPADRVEFVGFHEAGHDGSQQQRVTDAGVAWTTMESRGRNTGSRTAADVVVHPDAEIRAPASGTVIRAGTYVLYCDYQDSFLVIEPDGRPGWEVKMFHFQGLAVGVGDRVEAGVTVVGSQATVLAFESQVDEFTAEPSNPHVHVEVVDPSIPDIPTPGGGC